MRLSHASRRFTLCVLASVIVPSAAHASVSFQNTGTLAGWSNFPQHPCCGPIRQVGSPVFRGAEAIRFEQTFTGFGSYHNEVVQQPVAPLGSDTYFGFALFLPSDWTFHDQNVTFSQWARSDSSNTPWTLMFVQNNEVRTGGSGGIRRVWGTIDKGVWNRIVVRIRNDNTNGIFEVWINGVNRGRLTGDVSPDGPAIRWSAGQYATFWRTHEPTGNNPIVTYMDHFRVATTYAEAEPANWGGPGGTGRTQAEDMTKTAYETNSFEGVTCARATSTTTGHVRTTFTGSAGVYDILVRYMDENDGRATFTVRVNGAAVSTWTASTDDHTWKIRTVRGVTLPSGADIRVEGARQSGEHARVDYVEIR
jgi:hypothetical protein